MVFSSITFLAAFLPGTLVAYYIVPKKARNTVLLVSNLIFYGWGEPVYILLMILSTIIAYVTGLFVSKRNKLVRVSSVVVAVIWNVGVLLFFKYAGLIVETINGIIGIGIPELDLPLPIGISFYSFQILSYVIDVYRGKIKGQKNILYLAIYISLFPQLIAGPIVRYETVEKQITEREETPELFSRGICRFSVGLAKKVILANQAGNIHDMIMAMPQEQWSTVGIWIATAVFFFQIYFDFSGYSDMAIGLGKMFGFNFHENFNDPYISKNITEFWRRWHISLSSWFRDYVYIPLGGSRKGKKKQIVNIFLVWSLTGLWHGASWNFVLWGIYFAVLLLLEKFLLGKALLKAPGAIQHIYALFFILIGWAIFSCEDMYTLTTCMRTMFSAQGSWDDLFYLADNWLLIIVMILASTPFWKKITVYIGRQYPKVYGSVILPLAVSVLLMISIVFLVGESYNPFLYFRF